MQIRKGKLCGKTLKTYQIRNKPNWDNIFKSYLSYHILEGLCNSLDYFERLWKTLFAMIRQLGPSTFFVIFTFVKRLWDLLIKTLHTLHASRLNLQNKIKDLQFVHIAELIWIDPITCAIYYDHKTSYFCKFITQNIISFLGIFLNFFRQWIPKSWEWTWTWTFID